MNFSSERKRMAAGVCMKCEAVPVFKCYRCETCYEQYKLMIRRYMRENSKNTARSHWDPDAQAFVSFDDREAYDALRARIAVEMTAPGAKGNAVCEKYRMTWGRLRKICVEHGVVLTRKRGSGDHPKTPERLALEAQVIADARAGMYLKDLQKKYPGHEVRYICLKAGLRITKMPETEVQNERG